MLFDGTRHSAAGGDGDDNGKAVVRQLRCALRLIVPATGIVSHILPVLSNGAAELSAAASRGIMEVMRGKGKRNVSR